MPHEDELEAQRWLDTLAALASVERGEVVPSDQVHAWLRTWGTPDEYDIDVGDA